MSRSPAAVLMLVAQGLFLAVAFLVPVLALPWTFDPLETSKQMVLVMGSTVAAACFMVSLLLGSRIWSRPGVFVWVPLLILGTTAVSAAASLAPMTSWIGQGAQEYASVVSLLGFMSCFFLAKDLAREARLNQWLILTLFTSAAVVSLSLLPSFFGVQLGLFTTLIGPPHAAAIYLLVISSLACGLWLVGDPMTVLWQRRWLQAAMMITLTTCLAVLLVLDSAVLWGLGLVSSGVYFVTAYLHAHTLQDPGRFVPAMCIFILASIFLILPSPVRSPFLPEVAPNLETTLGVVTGAWNEGSIMFGSGPGTFSLVYPKYTALAVNNSDFWDLVFDRGHSYVTTQLATVGLLGTAAWLFFVILILVLAVKKIVAAETGWREILPFFAAWSVSVVAAFVYTQNLTLTLLFWLLSAVLASHLGSRIEAAHLPLARARFVTVLVTIIALVSAVTAVLVSAPRYLAEVAFARAVKLNGQADEAAEVDQVIHLLDKAAATNPWNDVYYRNLAGALLHRISLLSTEEAADSEYVQSLIATAISEATRATDISPANVLNWEVRGLVYRELLPVVPDAAQPASDAYEHAVELAPINPRYRVEAARAYMTIADLQKPLLDNADKDVAAAASAVQVDATAKAEEHLNTAIALKGDYAPSHYYLALLKERQGELGEAVRELELVREAAPEDVGVGLQLGLFYLRQGKNELAQAELERIIALAPAYADAHWYLSVVFEQQGDLPRAIAEVEKVLATNPENVAVQTRLDRLRAGETSETIPEPINLQTP